MIRIPYAVSYLACSAPFLGNHSHWEGDPVAAISSAVIYHLKPTKEEGRIRACQSPVGNEVRHPIGKVSSIDVKTPTTFLDRTHTLTSINHARVFATAPADALPLYVEPFSCRALVHRYPLYAPASSQSTRSCCAYSVVAAHQQCRTPQYSEPAPEFIRNV
jgi:hypothetical protein